MQRFKSDLLTKGHLQISIELESRTKDSQLARCPELGLSIRSEDREKAIKRLESMIIYCLTAADDFGISKGLMRHIETHGHVNVKKFINTTSH